MTKIALGKAGNHAVWIDLDVLLKTRALIEGNSGCGKSETLQYLAEQFDGKVQVIILDREGEFAILRKKHNYVLVGKGGDTPADCRSAAMLAHKLLELGASAVCDLYEMKDSERHRWVRLFLESLIDAPKHLWHPVIVIIDEIHTFCPEKGSGESEASDAVIDLATRGRKRGFCLIGATQRLGKFRKDAAAELLNIIVGMTFIDIDRKRAAEALGIPKSEERKFFDEIKVMDSGKFWVLGRAISKDRTLVSVNRIETPRAKAGSKHAVEPPPPPSSVRALLPKLADLPKAAEEKAKTEADLRLEIRNLKTELSKKATIKVTDSRHLIQPRVEIKTQRVEIPVVKAADVKRLERAAGRTGDGLRDIQAVADRVKTTWQNIEKVIRRIDSMAKAPPTTPKIPVRPEPVSASLPSKPADYGGHRPGLPSRETTERTTSNGELSPKQRKILTALSEFEEIGRHSVPRTWIAARSGSSPRSSAYANNLSALRSRGLIDYDGVGIRLLDAGRHEAPTPSFPLDADAMKESCLKLLSPKQRLIFLALYEAYPEPMSREDLASKAESSPTSSAYANNLSSLRSAGMIEQRRDGTEKLSDWVMVEKVVV